MAPDLDEHAEVYQALVVGLRDYVTKNGVGSVVPGLSGGIDSALVAAIACDALWQRERIWHRDALEVLVITFR